MFKERNKSNYKWPLKRKIVAFLWEWIGRLGCSEKKDPLVIASVK